MASNRVFMENPRTGQRRELPVGFSWTCLLFGAFPLMFRGAWKWVLISMGLAMITIGFSFLFIPFFINKKCIEDAVNDGFAVKAVLKGTVEELEASLGMNLPRV